MNFVKDHTLFLFPFPVLSRRSVTILAALLLLGAMAALTGCESDDCVNCVNLPPPVVPTGVHSISGDGSVLVQWYDISYHPYDGQYNANVERYFIYWRFYQDGDENDPGRTFEYLGEVAWNENFDPNSGLHWFEDTGAVNGERYEYAVAAVNADGLESALSYELVTDAPLPHSAAPVVLYDRDGGFPERSMFDFSLLEDGNNQGGTGFQADIQVFFQNGVPYVETVRSGVSIQDFGAFISGQGELVFEGVSWAPAEGYSSTGVLELITGHIYVLELNEGSDGLHYAKFGVLSVGSEVVEIIWAYQTISGLPELSVPSDGDRFTQPGPSIVSY
ncbi:hypothetical protein CSB20_02350 [bacterium DOLZORAL124_64_63]|nr:MAG: hypothetical protein CSB20_02350 [bacterium DOLZORAL124_64_63]